MAILEQKTELFSGDQLIAKTVNDISETAVEAYKLANEAKQRAETLIQEAIESALNSEV